MSHTLARIIHGGVELCLLKTIQEMLTDRKDAVLNCLSLFIEESVLPFILYIYFEEECGGMGTMADPFRRSCESLPWMIITTHGLFCLRLVMLGQSSWFSSWP